MCGITGFFSYKNKCSTTDFYNAHRKIAHRGPDDEGFIYRDSNGGLENIIGCDTISELRNRDLITNKSPSSLIIGHRRLSILDLTSQGHQPFSYVDLHLTYNGEIFNYVELRDELISVGYTFETQTDTEVFLKSYHYWGEDAFNKFNGMWAAAIYDSSKDCLLLTRDRFGIKPLYYSFIDSNFIFGSEIKFVSSFMDKLYPNEQMVYDYIEHGYISHTSDTFFAGIHQINPGSFAIIKNDSLVEKKYYKPYLNNIDDKIKAIKDIFHDSVRLRMRSDVAVGSLLSGGMDSSAVVCSIHEQGLTKNLDTFTLSYSEKFPDYERPYVDEIINKTGFNNNGVYLEPSVDILDELTFIIESPFRSFTENAMYNIYKYIKTNTDIKVLLNGEGADELFSGYNAHYSYFLKTLLCEGSLSSFLSEYKEIKRKQNKTHKSMIKDLVNCILEKKHVTRNWKRSGIFDKKKLSQAPTYSSNGLKNEVLSNRSFSALPEYLNYADKIAMNFSLEVRVPFLDYRLVEISDSFSTCDYIRNGVTKYVLREAVKDIVPGSVYSRVDKKGFFTPHSDWLKSSFSKKIESEIYEMSESGIFSFMNNDNILSYYKKNGIDQLIWRLYCLSRWKKVWSVQC